MQRSNPYTRLTLSAIVLATLTACGGGGDGLAPTTPEATPTTTPTTTPNATPDLIFSPTAISLLPDQQAQVQVRVDSGADLRGASFDLPGVQAGVTSTFVAAADGKTGTLTLAASTASEGTEVVLNVKGASGVDTSKLWVGALKVKTATAVAAKTIFVRPTVVGNDANDGSAGRPYRTLGKAASMALAGDTIQLLPGSYTKLSNGETYPVVIPAGVTLQGTLSANGVKTSVLSPQTSAEQAEGLTLLGDATLKDLELDSFGKAIIAQKGIVSMSNMNFFGNHQIAFLLGDTRATVSNSRAELYSRGSIVAAFLLRQQASLTLDATQIVAPVRECQQTMFGISLNEAAELVMKNGSVLQDIDGAGILMLSTNRATLIDSKLTRGSMAGCAVPYVGIDARKETTQVSLKNTEISGFASAGLKFDSPGALSISGGKFVQNGIGVNVPSTAHPTVSIFGTTIESNQTGMRVVAPSMKMRFARVINNQIGLQITGEGFGNIPAPGVLAIDLGAGPSVHMSVPLDEGKNDFSRNTITGVQIKQPNLNIKALIFAVGNQWNALRQGSNNQGKYPVGEFYGSQRESLVVGPNFQIFGSNNAGIIF